MHLFMCVHLQGFSSVATIFITPTFFGAAHLHHLHDLVVHRGMPLARAAAHVSFMELP